MTLLFLACTGAEPVDTAPADTDTVPTGPGTLALTFRMDDDYIAVMAESGETPVGPFEGSIFAEADANELGPVEGAVALLDFSVELDLLPDGGPTAALYTTTPLDPQVVWVLGCLNSDASAECGDEGDPITRPSENKFQVVAEVETTIEVYMGMLRP
jgi:hypothetical protein